MAALEDSQDVTLAYADSNIFQCWEKKVKQGRECSLLLEYKNGKVLTTFKSVKLVKSEARAPLPDSKPQAEKKKHNKGSKKLAKLLAFHKRLVDEKKLPQATSCIIMLLNFPLPT